MNVRSWGKTSDRERQREMRNGYINSINNTTTATVSKGSPAVLLFISTITLFI